MHFRQSRPLYYLYLKQKFKSAKRNKPQIGWPFLRTLVETNDKDASKPVARHFNLPNHSQKYMAVCGLSLHLGNTESCKNVKQKFISQIGTVSPSGIKDRYSFLQFSYIILVFVSTYRVTRRSLYK